MMHAERQVQEEEKGHAGKHCHVLQKGKLCLYLKCIFTSHRKAERYF